MDIIDYLFLVLWGVIAIAFIAWGIKGHPPLDEIDPRRNHTR